MLLILLLTLPNLFHADSLPSCELVHEGYKTYHCSQLSEEEWVADVHDASPESCLAACEAHSSCTHVTFHLDDNQAHCELQDCTGASGWWGPSEEDYLYHENSCYSSYQCRPVTLVNGAEPEVISFPPNATAGCHGVELMDESSCASYDKDNCFWLSEKCFWVQDSCTMVNLGAEAKETCEDPPAGSVAVFFICFFAAGCIAAVLVYNCPEFCETVQANVVGAAQKIAQTLFSVLSASFGIYEGINVSVVLGCLGDHMDLGSACSDALGLMESGTIIMVLFSSLSMILILVFSCGMMWFGLRVTDEFKLGLYFVHFFELGVLIGCAVGLSANPDNCSPEFGSIIDDQKTAFTKVIVFTVVYMVLDLLSFLGIDYTSVCTRACTSEGAEETAEKDEEKEPKVVAEEQCGGEEHTIDVDPVEFAPSMAEPVENVF